MQSFSRATTQIQRIVPDALAGVFDVRRVVWLLSSCVLILGILYVYFLGAAISNVLVREDVEQQIASTQSEISQLGGEYLARQSELTLEMARSYGLQQTSETHYVRRTNEGDTVTLNR